VALKPWNAVFIATWCAALLSYAGLGVYWFQSFQFNARVFAAWALLTVAIKSMILTLCGWKFQSIRGVATGRRYWIGFVARVVLTAALLCILSYLLLF
jgi:hypothetical protein